MRRGFLLIWEMLKSGSKSRVEQEYLTGPQSGHTATRNRNPDW